MEIRREIMQTVDQLRDELKQRCQSANGILISEIEKPKTIRGAAIKWVSIKFEYRNNDNLDQSIIYNFPYTEYIRCYEEIFKNHIYKIYGENTK